MNLFGRYIGEYGEVFIMILVVVLAFCGYVMWDSKRQ